MKYYFHNIIMLFLLSGLTACAVGPDFKRPVAPADQRYSAETNLAKFGNQRINTQQAVSTVWWQALHSNSLNDVINTGVSNSYTLAAARETLAQAREIALAAKGQLWPQLSLDAIAGRQKYGIALFGPTNFVIPPFTYYELGPSLTYVLDVFGGTRRTIEKQEALATYEAFELDAAYLALTGNITSTALTIATINDEIATTHAIIKEDQKNLELVRQSFNLGSGTEVDVLSAKSQLNNDETLLPTLSQQLTVAQDTLNVLVGKTPANWQPPVFTLNGFGLPTTLPLSLPSELVHSRPDIMAAEAMLHSASASVGIATANLYPSISITAASLQEALVPSNLFKASANAWSYAGSLTAPIFEGGTLRAQKRAAEHAYQLAYANYQQVIIKAFVQVNEVLHALKNDADELRAQQNAVATAIQSLKLARLSYNAGNVGILQVLDAERLYTQARLGLDRTKGQRYQDTVQLYLVLGGGLLSG
jgi:NodT family efflux transporter outer membrane factor (OMF) lipoprotein